MTRLLTSAAIVAVLTATSAGAQEIPVLKLGPMVEQSPIIQPADEIRKFLDSVDQKTGIHWRSLNLRLQNGQLMFVRCNPGGCEWGIVPPTAKISQR